jgi:hypothetical protein
LYNIENYDNNKEIEEEVYYEESNLLGGIENIGYCIEYGVDCKNIEDKA